MENLKPCPCGHETASVKSHNRMVFVYCTKCGWRGPTKYDSVEINAEAEAIAAWDERADSWVKIITEADMPKDAGKTVLWLADNGYIEMGDSETYYESSRAWTHWQEINLPKE